MTCNGSLFTAQYPSVLQAVVHSNVHIYASRNLDSAGSSSARQIDLVNLATKRWVALQVVIGMVCKFCRVAHSRLQATDLVTKHRERAPFTADTIQTS